MPQLGETVAEGKITKWFVAPGTAVKPGDNLFEIETDKVSMEVPSITTGTLDRDQGARPAPSHRWAPVVAIIAGEGGATRQRAGRCSAAAPPSLHRPLNRSVPRKRDQCRTGSPLARGRTDRGELACENSIRSSRCARRSRNFGPAHDHRRHAVTPLARGSPARTASISRASRAPARAAASSRPTSRRRSAAAPAAAAPAMATGASAEQVKALYQGVDFEEVPLDGMRKTIADAPRRSQADHPALLSRQRRRRWTR